MSSIRISLVNIPGYSWHLAVSPKDKKFVVEALQQPPVASFTLHRTRYSVFPGGYQNDLKLVQAARAIGRALEFI